MDKLKRYVECYIPVTIFEKAENQQKEIVSNGRITIMPKKVLRR